MKTFLYNTLNAFTEELNVVAESMYRYPNNYKGIDQKESINDVFALIERSYIGLYNNAVIRSFPEDTTLQEFTVYQKEENDDRERHKGRADLFIVHKIGKGFINLLFEAKAYQAEWKEDTPEEMKCYYRKLHDQAISYYNAEKEFYEGVTYIITINFDWIRSQHLLKEVIQKEFIDDGCTDFYYIYHTKEAGLMVYGSVTEVDLAPIAPELSL